MLPDIDNDILLILSEIFDSLGSISLAGLVINSTKLFETKDLCLIFLKWSWRQLYSVVVDKLYFFAIALNLQFGASISCKTLDFIAADIFVLDLDMELMLILFFNLDLRVYC